MLDGFHPDARAVRHPQRQARPIVAGRTVFDLHNRLKIEVETLLLSDPAGTGRRWRRRLDVGAAIGERPGRQRIETAGSGLAGAVGNAASFWRRSEGWLPPLLAVVRKPCHVAGFESVETLGNRMHFAGKGAVRAHHIAYPAQLSSHRGVARSEGNQLGQTQSHNRGAENELRRPAPHHRPDAESDDRQASDAQNDSQQ